MALFTLPCPPAILFFILAFLRILYSVNKGQHLLYALTRFIMVLILTYALNWLCKQGYTSVAYLLVLLPIIINLTINGWRGTFSAGLRFVF